MSKVILKDVNKTFDGKNLVVKNFNLEIKDKDFLVLIGPSGCGKTTVLNMIAGLERVTSGDIFIDDKLVNFIEPKDRDIAMVFQKLIGTVISGFLRFRVKIRFFPRTTTVFAPRTTNPIRIFRQRRLQEV